VTQLRRSLPLEGRVAAHRPGGVVGDAPRAHIIWNMGHHYQMVADGRNNPLWPLLGHLPLKGGE
jgi:hypothetical protein